MVRLLGRVRHTSDPNEALEELLLCFVQFLAELPLAQVQVLREMLVTRFADAKLNGDELLTVVDGHLAYRELCGK